MTTRSFELIIECQWLKKRLVAWSSLKQENLHRIKSEAKEKARLGTLVGFEHKFSDRDKKRVFVLLWQLVPSDFSNLAASYVEKIPFNFHLAVFRTTPLVVMKTRAHMINFFDVCIINQNRNWEIATRKRKLETKTRSSAISLQIYGWALSQ